METDDQLGRDLEAFTEMIEVWSVTEPDEEGWPR